MTYITWKNTIHHNTYKVKFIF